jgi:hypothetical protein
MGYYDELNDGHKEMQAEAGEVAVYDNTVTFLGLFEEIDPASQIAAAGFDEVDSLICDATKDQFVTAPVKGKRVLYRSRTYVVRNVYEISGLVYRFRLYLP